MSTATIDPRVPWPARLAYAAGNAGETILHRSFELFVLFYYTQVLGLSGTIAGLAILLAMIVDAITDPLVGTYSDSLQSRWGRRHTLMFAAAVPTTLLFILLFNPPDGLAGLALGAWLAATAIGVRVAITFFHIPWATQIAELTADPKERVTLAVLRNIFGAVAQAAIVVLAFDLYFSPTDAYPRGQENPSAYPAYGVAFGIGLGVLILLSAAGTYRRLRLIERTEPPRTTRFSLTGLAHAWRDMVFDFPNFRALFLGALFALAAISVFNAFALYMGSYYWKLSSEQIKQWQIAFVIGAAVTFIVGKPIIDRTRPATVFWVCIAIGTAMFALPVLLHLIGLLPDEPQFNLTVLRLTNGLAGFFLGLVLITSALLASETADEYELKRGVKGTALLFGFITLAMKLASGLGKLLTGVAIDLIRLPAADDAASITPAQTTALGWACLLCTIVLGAIGVAAFSRYRSPSR